MELTFDSTSFDEAVESYVKNDMYHVASELIKLATFSLVRNLVMATPVGNPELWKTKYPPKGYTGGHARAAWQVSFGDPIEVDIDANVVDASGEASLASGVGLALGYGNLYNMTRTGEAPVVWIVNNAPYIERLNDGWSSQAPAGFFETALSDTAAEFDGLEYVGDA
jgi:hypothetical protein